MSCSFLVHSQRFSLWAWENIRSIFHQPLGTVSDRVWYLVLRYNFQYKKRKKNSLWKLRLRVPYDRIFIFKPMHSACVPEPNLNWKKTLHLNLETEFKTPENLAWDWRLHVCNRKSVLAPGKKDVTVTNQGGPNERLPVALWEMEDPAFFGSWPILGTKRRDTSASAAENLAILVSPPA